VETNQAVKPGWAKVPLAKKLVSKTGAQDNRACDLITKSANGSGAFLFDKLKLEISGQIRES
jgi:hypothetical protein